MAASDLLTRCPSHISVSSVRVERRADESVGVQLPRRLYKRPLDVALGLVFLAASSPLLGLIAVMVKLSSPGPVLFRQQRLGRDGRPFTVFKFRTMYADVDHTPHEEYFKQYLKGEPALTEPGRVFKLRRDPRITPVGRVLRRLGLDELPQLMNVLRGDMSLVGPRPALPYEVAHYSDRHLQRMLVKPGLTGIWQVRGRDVVDFESMIDMDLEYVARHGLLLDLWIMTSTLPALLWAYVKH